MQKKLIGWKRSETEWIRKIQGNNIQEYAKRRKWKKTNQRKNKTCLPI